MAKDIKNAVEILDGNLSKMGTLLDEGKTVLVALETGKFVSTLLESDFSSYWNAKLAVKEKKQNAGICSCGKPADVLVYFWRD